MAISISRPRDRPTVPAMPGAGAAGPNLVGVALDCRPCSRPHRCRRRTAPLRATKVPIRATRVSLFSTMSMKLASTFTLRPLTVWVPSIEVSHPYGTKVKVHPDGAATGATTGGEGGGRSAASAAPATPNRRPSGTGTARRNRHATACIIPLDPSRTPAKVRVVRERQADHIGDRILRSLREIVSPRTGPGRCKRGRAGNRSRTASSPSFIQSGPCASLHTEVGGSARPDGQCCHRSTP